MLLLVAAVALAAGATAYAHHSYAATYDVSKEVKLEGKLVQFVYRNPHSFVHVQATDQDGVQQRWAVEWAGTTQLGNQGVKSESLKVGDQVVIVGRLHVGNPHRRGGRVGARPVTTRRAMRNP